MWNCTNCGKENRDDRNHCWSCSVVKGATPPEDSSTSQKVETRNIVDDASICSTCSAPIDDDAVFCPSCAAPVSPKCPSCGKTVNAEAKFCKYCAFDLKQKAPATKLDKPRAVSTVQPLPPQRQFSSGIDTLLAEKYHAMSDSELLTMLKGDVSGQTEKSLSIALAELETRPNIDWRDMSIAKTRLKEAIIAASTHSSFSSPTNTYRSRASHNLTKEKAERLAKAGGITAGISAILFLWGYSYTSNWSNSARAGLKSLAGQTDATYSLASLCVSLGAIGFLIGVTLFIVGMAQRDS